MRASRAAPTPQIGELELRPATTRDAAILFEIFAATRAAEMAGVRWDARMKTRFLRQQHAAQRVEYEARFPAARHHVVTLRGRPVGHFWLAVGADEVRVLDIAFLPRFERDDRWAWLVALAQAEAVARGLPLRLCVLKADAYRRGFFEALGFVRIGEQPIRDELEWSRRSA